MASTRQRQGRLKIRVVLWAQAVLSWGALRQQLARAMQDFKDLMAGRAQYASSARSRKAVVEVFASLAPKPLPLEPLRDLIAFAPPVTQAPTVTVVLSWKV